MFPDRASTERGFTLLEVLVAFVIAALAFTVLFQAAGGGVGAVDTAGRYEEAISRARSHLASIGRETLLATGGLRGDDGGGYHWRIDVQPLGQTKAANPDEQNDGEPNPPWPVALYRVSVGISWHESGRTHEVGLQTERLAALQHVQND